MDWFQSVVLDYLRIDRRLFVNPECLIRLDPEGLPKKVRHWYCDALAAHFGERTLYLCEITYANQPLALIRRLTSWQEAWLDVSAAVMRGACAPADWSVRPWVFVPQARLAKIAAQFQEFALADRSHQVMPAPRQTALDDVLPWRSRRAT